MPGMRLSFQERCEIGRRLKWGLSMRDVAAALGRPCSTVSRELARNGGRGRYRAVFAQNRWFNTKRRPKPYRLESNRRLARRVEQLLRRRWSPEQIAERLRRDHPHDSRWWVSPEAIYRSIYVQARGGLRQELSLYLRRRHWGRKRQTHNLGHLRDMVMISDRPPDVEDRAIPGHWEGDLIMGHNGRSQVGILAERTTRYTVLFPLPDKRAETVSTALQKVVKSLPEQLRRSLTLDQGKEFANHAKFTVATGLRVYFCDPARPWQRPTAENTVGLVRQYLPKGEALSDHTQRSLNAITRELNERPRKSLGWDSPAEAYSQLLLQ